MDHRELLNDLLELGLSEEMEGVGMMLLELEVGEMKHLDLGDQSGTLVVRQDRDHWSVGLHGYWQTLDGMLGM